MKLIKYCGFNYGNLEESGDEVTSEFKEIAPKLTSNDFLVIAESFYEIQIFNDLRKFMIISNLKENINNITVNFNNKIIDAQSTSESCYFLHENGQISKYNVINASYQILSFVSEKLIHISARYESLFGVTESNCVYQLVPEVKSIKEFPKHQKICKMSSGLEHTILLTKNGDVYSFGCGLRGQLGHGNVSSHNVPKLINAINGIKIIDISCGAFHSCLVSSFNDLYTFGWNSCGQLGIRSKNANESIQKHQQVFALPQLIDLEDESDGVKKVFCGRKHTIFQTESNRLFSTGSNKFGQLGLGDTIDRDSFNEIPCEIKDDSLKISCGCWSTYVIFNV